MKALLLIAVMAAGTIGATYTPKAEACIYPRCCGGSDCWYQ